MTSREAIRGCGILSGFAAIAFQILRLIPNLKKHSNQLIFSFICSLTILSHSSVCYGNSRSDDQGIQLKSVDLIEVTYAYALMDIELFVSEEESLKNILSAMVFAPDIAGGNVSFRNLKHGLNRVRVQLNRHKLSTIDMDTHQLKMRLNIRGEENRSIIGKRLLIQWPGSEYVHKLVNNYTERASDFKSVREVVISSALPERHRIYKALLTIGVPIEKIRFKYFYRATYGLSAEGVMKGEELRRIIAAVIGSSENEFGFSNYLTLQSSIVIGNNTPDQTHVSRETYKKLLINEISDADFLSLIAVQYSSPEEETDNLYQEAKSLLDSGKPNELKKAKALLDELIAIAPDFPQAYIELARFHIKVNPNEVNNPHSSTLIRAERNILIAKKLDPRMADVYVLLGYVYANQLRYKEAADAFEKAEQIGTNNLWLYANRGLNFEKQNMIDRAITEYTKVIRASHSPESGSSHYHSKDWSYRRMFAIYNARNQFKEIDELYQRYAMDFPWKPCTALWQASVKLLQLDDEQGAIDSYLTAKSKGCRQDTPIISVAYFKKWSDLKTQNEDRYTIQQVLRQARGTAPSDAELFFTMASSAHTAELIPVIEQEGYNINSPNQSKQTALLIALQQDDLEVIERLLRYGANPNFRPHENTPLPLAIAIYLRNKAIVQLLLKHGADPNEQVQDGISILKWAEMNDYKEFLFMLKERSESGI